MIPSSSENLDILADNSISLVITSPPYPMIEMWDDVFCKWDPRIGEELARNDGPAAFSLMHKCLDRVWKECARVLMPGGFACINTGDATRTIGDRFRLYSSHSRIVQAFSELGFDCLPLILWKKSTNAPNKFMGSGMYPAGAYVTLEHEYILVFRKGPKRGFAADDKKKRRESAFFWEERNVWFSDTWTLPGERQALRKKNMRERSAAYPLELAHRLVNMYSLKGDTILDPFLGTGTTLLACMLNARSCTGYEIDNSLAAMALNTARNFATMVPELVEHRIADHLEFIETCTQKKGPPKYMNDPHGFPVITQQEKDIKLETLANTETGTDTISCTYRLYTTGNRQASLFSF